MKSKYVIVITIGVNLILLILFLYNRYDCYNQKYSYQHNIKTISTQLIKETENTMFYSYLDPPINLLRKNILVFNFSIEACQPCLEKICNEIELIFPDYSTNKNIMFFSSDLEERLRRDFLGKQITTSLKKDKSLSFEKYHLPLLFILDSNNTIHNIFIPDKDNLDALRIYLEEVQNKYL